jgi:endonuclease YncB( thermonuclease family)
MPFNLPIPSNRDEIYSFQQRIKRLLCDKYMQARQWFQSQSQGTQFGIVGVSTLVFFLSCKRIYQFSFQRIRNVNNITEYDLKRQRRLKGLVPHVGDGDNFRFYHVPAMVPIWWVRRFSLASYPRTAWWFGFQNKKRMKLDEYTLHVRLAGMDAPECAHFGAPGQEYGPIAKEYLSNLLINHSVTIYPLHKDQYNRLVCSVYIRAWSHWLKLVPLNVSAHMIEQGLGVVYEGQGEVWSEGNEERNLKMKQYLMKLQQRAMQQKRGMWAKKHTSISPRDYKREIRNNS